MFIRNFFASSLCVFFVVSTALAEEVIWRIERTGASSSVVPDRVSNSTGPGGAEFSDYLLAQVLVQCNPGEPRVGLPGRVNGIRTFFLDDAEIDFDQLPGSMFNPETGLFEIPGLARVNVFQVPTPTLLPQQIQNPDFGIVVEAIYSQDPATNTITVRAFDLLNTLPAPIVINENTPYYIGLTPVFLGLPQNPFGGIHYTNDVGVGNENQSAVRQTAPVFDEWFFAGDIYGPPQQMFATIEINGPPLFKLGDVNMDGDVNLLDVEPFVALLGSGKFKKEADINGDGFVNLLDVEPFISILGS